MTDKARKTLHSSKSVEWGTPQEFFDQYNKIYNFDLDVCATPELAKCKKFFSPKDDGLSKDWKGKCWMNPPYGREIKKWVKKANEEIINGNAEIIVALLPSRTGSGWFQDYVLFTDQKVRVQIEFIRGRLKFKGAENSAPFDSVIVIYKQEAQNEL